MTQLTFPIAMVFLMSLALGCSLVLEPQTVCDSDSDCKKGTCLNGVCVIEPESEDTSEPDASMMTPEADMGMPQGGASAPDALVQK